MLLFIDIDLCDVYKFEVKRYKLTYCHILIPTSSSSQKSFFNIMVNITNRNLTLSFQMEVLNNLVKILKSYTIEGVDPTIPGNGGKECTEFLTINR